MVCVGKVSLSDAVVAHKKKESTQWEINIMKENHTSSEWKNIWEDAVTTLYGSVVTHIVRVFISYLLFNLWQVNLYFIGWLSLYVNWNCILYKKEMLSSYIILIFVQIANRVSSLFMRHVRLLCTCNTGCEFKLYTHSMK